MAERPALSRLRRVVRVERKDNCARWYGNTTGRTRLVPSTRPHVDPPAEVPNPRLVFPTLDELDRNPPPDPQSRVAAQPGRETSLVYPTTLYLFSLTSQVDGIPWLVCASGALSPASANHFV